MGRSLFLLAILATAGCVNEHAGTGGRTDTWVLDAEPVVRLGHLDDSVAFGQVVGATLLPGGQVLVADLDAAPFSLLVFSSDGTLVRKFGRLGNGPGEIVEGVSRLLRCGDIIAVFDYAATTYSVFTLSGSFVRRAPIDGPNGQTPYQSACNSKGDILSYEWPPLPVRPLTGISRDSVPLWLRRPIADSAVSFGLIPGSERWGDAPYPLGKETVLAAGDDRLYLGFGDTYEITVMDFNGRRIAAIRKSVGPRPTAAEDINDFRDRSLAVQPPALQQGERRRLDTLTFPDRLPAYRMLRVDRSQNLWVEEYPHAGTVAITWTVFDRAQREIATALAPRSFDVLEIGDDYLLGLYIDPHDATPEVRVYRLRKS